MPQAALLQEAETAPSAFSPNVLLRPIVQDTLFPTICYVAGPNELAYLGQLRAIYNRFDVAMPLMYPRASMTLLDAPAMRFLTKYRLPLEALQAQDESALNQLLESQIPPAIEAPSGRSATPPGWRTVISRSCRPAMAACQARDAAPIDSPGPGRTRWTPRRTHGHPQPQRRSK